MKKIIVFLAVLMLVASTASAATKAKAKKKVVKKVVVEESVPGHFFIRAQGGADFLLSGVGYLTADESPFTLVSPGWGYNVEAGYAFSEVFTASLLYGYQVWAISIESAPDEAGSCMSYFPVQAVAKFTVPGDSVRFYGFLGIGMAFNCWSMWESMKDYPVDGTTAAEKITYEYCNFLLSPGVGLEIPVSDRVNLFFQTKMDINFIGKDLADEMSTTNKNFDTPAWVMPLQAGVELTLP